MPPACSLGSQQLNSSLIRVRSSSVSTLKKSHLSVLTPCIPVLIPCLTWVYSCLVHNQLNSVYLLFIPRSLDPYGSMTHMLMGRDLDVDIPKSENRSGSWLCWTDFVNFIQSRVTWKEGNLPEELPPSDGLVGVCGGIFLIIDWYRESPAHSEPWGAMLFNKTTSKQNCSMASASVPASKFLPWVPSLDSLYNQLHNLRGKINPFLSKLF